MNSLAGIAGLDPGVAAAGSVLIETLQYVLPLARVASVDGGRRVGCALLQHRERHFQVAGRAGPYASAAFQNLVSACAVLASLASRNL